jgi:aldehyde:ferredoxin oxidoreductase
MNYVAGQVLVADLTHHQTSILPLPESLYERYLGGSGLAVRLLFDRIAASADPLGADNVLAFTVGPLTGSPVPTSNRFTAAALSPKTGFWGEADCGGRWGGALKRAGFDGVLILGRAETPVSLWIEGGQAEIRDAAHLWGVDTYDLELPGQVVSIGPAGENLVPMAAIMHDGRHGRAAGRCGLGAVMGSKRLKAVAVHGTNRYTASDPAGLAHSLRQKVPEMRNASRGMRDYGTGGGLENTERIGNLPIQNWKKGSWSGAARISGVVMAETILTDSYACAGCPIGCGRVIRIEEGPYRGVEGAGPEYETLAAFGSMCLIDDLEAIAKLNELCNRYGLDTISTGSTVAFAMEARERGLLPNGPQWGDAAAAINLVTEIAHNESEMGRLLSGGVKQAADRLGGNAADFAVHVKGLELPMHEPRAFWGAALGYATSERGACHLQGFTHVYERLLPPREFGHDEIVPRSQAEGKGELVANTQHFMALLDSLKMCKFALFSGVDFAQILEWTRMVTGYDLDQEKALVIGERIQNLRRLFNLRRGVSVKDDTLPARILVRRRGEGGAPDTLPPLGRMLADHYAFRGWTPEGVPTRAKLMSLGLGPEADLLRIAE